MTTNKHSKTTLKPARAAQARKLSSNPIMNEQEARIWVDSILDNTDTDTPEPLSRLLVFLAAYQTDPFVVDAFDSLLSAAFARSPAFYDGRDAFVQSQQDRVGIIRLSS